MKQTFRVYDIDWDTDGEDPEELGLPETFDIDVDIPDGLCDEGDVVGDAISDKYGYCFNGVSYDVLDEDTKEDEKLLDILESLCNERVDFDTVTRYSDSIVIFRDGKSWEITARKID